MSLVADGRVQIAKRFEHATFFYGARCTRTSRSPLALRAPGWCEVSIALAAFGKRQKIHPISAMETDTINPETTTAEPLTVPKSSLVGLVRYLTNDLKTFLRQEVDLAKAEISEKAAWFGKNVVMLAVGGFVAYAGLIVFLIGLGWLVAWALQKAGLQPLLAGFLGLTIIGLLVVGAGAAFIFKGLKVFASDTLVPQRTLSTIQRLRGSVPQPSSAKENSSKPLPSSKEMQARVVQTENRMSETLDELGRRLSPQQINARMKERIRQKPYRSGLVVMGVGLLGGLFLGRESRRT